MKKENYDKLVEEFVDLEDLVYGHIERYKEFYGDGCCHVGMDSFDECTVELSGVETWRYGGREEHFLTLEVDDLFSEERMNVKLKKRSDEIIKEKNKKKRAEQRKKREKIKAARKLLKDNNEL